MFCLQKHDDLKQLLAERSEQLAHFKLTLQPFVVLVGPSLENIQSFIVVVDNVEWRANSLLHAVDICFKLFFSLGAAYPHESRHIWLFIQKCVYKFSTESDFTKDSYLKSFLACHIKDFETFLENEVSSV